MKLQLLRRSNECHPQHLTTLSLAGSEPSSPRMPGLLNCVTGAALPLTASEVTSYVSGYALGLTASLTYGNLEAQPFQGKTPVWTSWAIPL